MDNRFTYFSKILLQTCTKTRYFHRRQIEQETTPRE